MLRVRASYSYSEIFPLIISNMYGDNLVFREIPSLNSLDEYNANVTYYAFAPATAKSSEESYELIQYLMNYEYDMCYGFSVNKIITEKQINAAQNDVLSVYPNSWGALEAGYIDTTIVENNKTNLQPLNSQEAAAIQYMLDNINGAGLPCSILEYNLMWWVIEQLGNDSDSIEKMVDWTLDKMSQYIEDIICIPPYDEGEYIKGILTN